MSCNFGLDIKRSETSLFDLAVLPWVCCAILIHQTGESCGMIFS